MIIVVRHGETVWNLQKRKQGRMDSPLTLHGINQVANVADKLSQIKHIKHFEFRVSPLWRAQQSASIIADMLHLDFQSFVTDTRLAEHSFGQWEGLTDEEIDLRFPGCHEARASDRWNYVIPAGESYELISQRVAPLIDESKDKRVVFITHEMISKVIRGRHGGLSNEETLALDHKHYEIYKLMPRLDFLR